jgi:hypothetical protein
VPPSAGPGIACPERVCERHRRAPYDSSIVGFSYTLFERLTVGLPTRGRRARRGGERPVPTPAPPRRPAGARAPTGRLGDATASHEKTCVRKQPRAAPASAGDGPGRPRLRPGRSS